MSIPHSVKTLLFLILLGLTTASSALAADAVAAYAISDSTTGFILEESNGAKKLQIGSLTKIATAMVVLDWSASRGGDLAGLASIPDSALPIAAAEGGQQVIILNPTTPIGPNDAKPTPTGRIFVDFLNGKFPAYMDTGLNLVDVAEVARTHVAALTVGQPGKRYILGGENLTLKQILDKMSAITGIPSPTVKIPFDVAATYAFFEEWITGRIRGREPRATLEEVRMGRKKMYASSARAQQELGFRILPVYPAMRAAIDWFRANGYAPANASQAGQ